MTSIYNIVCSLSYAKLKWAEIREIYLLSKDSIYCSRKKDERESIRCWVWCRHRSINRHEQAYLYTCSVIWFYAFYGEESFIMFLVCNMWRVSYMYVVCIWSVSEYKILCQSGFWIDSLYMYVCGYEMQLFTSESSFDGRTSGCYRSGSPLT